MNRLETIRSQKGFTIVALMIVVGIIAILAALLQFTEYRNRNGYRAELYLDLRNAYTAAQAYFVDNPTATVDALSKLTSAGYQKSSNVIFNSGTLTASSGTLTLSHASLPGGVNTGTVASNGIIVMP